MGSGYTYLQEFLPNVAQAVVRQGWVDVVGLGRMVLSYPELPLDVLDGRGTQKKRICRTFSDCTTAPRNGLVSGCYPLDAFYKKSPGVQDARRGEEAGEVGLSHAAAKPRRRIALARHRHHGRAYGAPSCRGGICGDRVEPDAPARRDSLAAFGVERAAEPVGGLRDCRRRHRDAEQRPRRRRGAVHATTAPAGGPPR